MLTPDFDGIDADLSRGQREHGACERLRGAQRPWPAPRSFCPELKAGQSRGFLRRGPGNASRTLGGPFLFTLSFVLLKSACLCLTLSRLFTAACSLASHLLLFPASVMCFYPRFQRIRKEKKRESLTAFSAPRDRRRQPLAVTP